eukprot:gene24811-10456_t
MQFSGVARFTLAIILSSCALASASASEDALVEWLQGLSGFRSRVKIGKNADGVRGIFATGDIKEADTILTIPTTAIFNIAILNIGGYLKVDSYTEPTARLLKQMRAPASRFRPYLDSLPRTEEVANICNIPLAYYYLLPEGYWESQYRTAYTQIRDLWAGNSSEGLSFNLAEALGLDSANVGWEEVKYACALALSRKVYLPPRKAYLMLPLLDMANHKKGCTTYIGAFGVHMPDDGHVHLIAGSDIKAGEELRDDELYMQYGFLFPGENGATSRVFRNGSYAETESEIGRLKKVQTSMADLTPAVEEGFAEMHARLLQLRGMRKDAIKTEIKRLTTLLPKLSKGTPSEGAGHEETKSYGFSLSSSWLTHSTENPSFAAHECSLHK